MSEVELVCANCGKPGGLSEEVKVESTGYRKLTVKIVNGEQKVEKGWIEDTGLHEQEIGTGDISCSHCGEHFATLDEATAQEVREYRCGECGWWGLQDWLHPLERPGCDGELTKERIGSTALSDTQLKAATK